MIILNQKLISLGNQDIPFWQEDPEFVYCDSAYYATFIDSLGQVSRGVFEPTGIKEEWYAGPRCPIIYIGFYIGSSDISIVAKRNNDFLDFRILPLLNHYIKSSGYHFALYETSDEPIIVAVTPKERHELQNTLKWNFTDFTPKQITEFILEPIEYRIANQEFSACIDDLDFAISLDPSEPQLYFYRGVVYFESGKEDLAYQQWALAASYGLTNVYDIINAKYNKDAS